MSLIKNLLIQITGSRPIQNYLERNVIRAQYLMGIGAGGGVMSSGERSIFTLLQSTAKPPYCIFDVGANVGDFIQLANDSLPEIDLAIHAFEPSEKTFAALSSRWGSDKRVVLNNCGIGDQKGNATLHSNSDRSGLASMTKRRLGHMGIEFDRAEKVSLDTIDDYCSSKGIDHIHLLKIDIEGHELDALSGAQNMFSESRIDLVSFEFGGCNIDTRTYFQDFWYFFSERGMKLFRVTPSGFLHPITSYRESHEQFRTVNFVALRDCKSQIQISDSPSRLVKNG